MTQGRMISDNELIVRSRAGDPDAEEELAVRYSPLVRFYSRTYFLAGGDSEDLIQEGMIGLLSAIRRFDPAMSVSFRTMVFRLRIFSTKSPIPSKPPITTRSADGRKNRYSRVSVRRKF